MLAVFLTSGNWPIPWLIRKPAPSPAPIVTVAGEANTGMALTANLDACCLVSWKAALPTPLIAAISLAGTIGGLGAPLGLVATEYMSLIAWADVLTCSLAKPYTILVTNSAALGAATHNAA